MQGAHRLSRILGRWEPKWPPKSPWPACCRCTAWMMLICSCTAATSETGALGKPLPFVTSPPVTSHMEICAIRLIMPKPLHMPHNVKRDMGVISADYLPLRGPTAPGKTEAKSHKKDGGVCQAEGSEREQSMHSIARILKLHHQ